MERIPGKEAVKAACGVCFRRCRLSLGETGPCLGRKNKNGAVVPVNYAAVTSLALDPIEKKPLARFHPGARILSVGSYGCNLFCPFCQNHEIAHPEASVEYRRVSPEELCRLAEGCREEGNIGVAYTYNEPLVAWEYVRDAAKLVRQSGMVNVLVTNGSASEAVQNALFPLIDAMNIDIKAFSPAFYRDYLKGDFETVKRFIERAVSVCHVELTMLVIPGKNDGEEELERLTDWIAGLNGGKGAEIPLHLSRYFPRYRENIPATLPETIYRLVELAGKRLRYVYPGNC